jgi:hypothetical protein
MRKEPLPFEKRLDSKNKKAERKGQVLYGASDRLSGIHMSQIELEPELPEGARFLEKKEAEEDRKIRVQRQYLYDETSEAFFKLPDFAPRETRSPSDTRRKFADFFGGNRKSKADNTADVDKLKPEGFFAVKHLESSTRVNRVKDKVPIRDDEGYLMQKNLGFPLSGYDDQWDKLKQEDRTREQNFKESRGLAKTAPVTLGRKVIKPPLQLTVTEPAVTLGPGGVDAALTAGIAPDGGPVGIEVIEKS